jgi:hypothetical protein
MKENFHLPDYSWDTLIDVISKLWGTELTSIDGSPITFGEPRSQWELLTAALGMKLKNGQR